MRVSQIFCLNPMTDVLIKRERTHTDTQRMTWEDRSIVEVMELHAVKHLRLLRITRS